MPSRPIFDYKGIFVPIVSPFDEDINLDLPSLERLIEHIIGTVDGFVINGKTQEFTHLQDSQRKDILTRAAGQIGRKKPIVANVTYPWAYPAAMQMVLEAVKHEIDLAAEAGADAVMVCPFYSKPVSTSRLFDFVGALAEHSPLPLFLYNNPELHHKRVAEPGLLGKLRLPKAQLDRFREPYNIPASVVGALSSHRNVLGIKDSSGDLAYFFRLMEYATDTFRVFQGSEKHIAKSHADAREPHGIVPSLANVAPGLVRYLYEDPTGFKQYLLNLG